MAASAVLNTSTATKPKLSFWQLWNMNFGFFGIQFGWGLQLANMSAIYAQLKANPDEIPILWLAGPVTGLLIQPIIGSASDRTWTKFGRRRPYFFVGALLSSLGLFFMPESKALWMAAVARGPKHDALQLIAVQPLLQQPHRRQRQARLQRSQDGRVELSDHDANVHHAA